ncbi:Phosphoacetylglucosamine mutase [Nadsonia fulvescens var. elongata DSM 6958]|uniref:Phosphoacetylglucosamine mutase n=1 Tax=Nadsonia fulvescens var. elongata DSM 6958 TaxID=857566 RepID=A0A1E3PSZ2_9ASCO|nr:Phosphoacetylglucosamine mutase [Nadsonia fulvescens var. elongata DSM 6958]
MSNSLTEYSLKHARPSNIVYGYGTAGFRMKATLLDSVVFRVGLLAGLRSRFLDGKTIGIMITASHNPPEDNGVKLVDPMGEMLEASWESHATSLANAETEADLILVYEGLVAKFSIDLSRPARVVFAKDSRESGPALVAALVDGLKAVNAEFHDCGMLTTPQLHYNVRCLNTQGTERSYGVPTEAGYFNKLTSAYKTILSSVTQPYSITIDAANGIGGPKVAELAKELSNLLAVTVVNNNYDKPELLNHACGADYVKTGQKLPSGVTPEPSKLYASFDGDADRIVFYFQDETTKFHLLDGDKIATLAAMYLGDLIKQAEVDLNLGVVQTAYANGSSTDYIQKNLNLPVLCTPTGVKHLHHAALQFDIGVYFEANGHGTVLFGENCIDALKAADATSPGQLTAIATLLAFSELINQTVGDAISDLLMVLAILSLKNWTCAEWAHIYTDLPNRLAKVIVNDRRIFTTTDAERKLVTPEGLQGKIDEMVMKYSNGRSFVRASGTEDAVRVYAECGTVGEVDDLVKNVVEIVKNSS